MQKNIITFEYNKLNLKEITILIPKNHANLNSFLTPILGLYGINLKEFIKEFTEKTKFADNWDIILPVKVLITKIKTFFMRLCSPYISSILNLTADFNKNILNFYKIFLLKSVYCGTNSLLVFKYIYRNIRVYLNKTYKINNFYNSKTPILHFDNFFFFKRPEILLLRKLIYSKYAVVFFFFNHASYKISEWKKDLIKFNLKILCIKKNLNIFLDFFKKDLYLLGSDRLNRFFSFMDNNTLKEVSTFKPFLWKFNTNFLSNYFFIEKIYNFLNKNKFLSIYRFLTNTQSVFVNICFRMFIKIFYLFYLRKCQLIDNL